MTLSLRLQVATNIKTISIKFKYSFQPELNLIELRLKFGIGIPFLLSSPGSELPVSFIMPDVLMLMMVPHFKREGIDAEPIVGEDLLKIPKPRWSYQMYLNFDNSHRT